MLSAEKLRVAQYRKRDEFYTLYGTIEDEVEHYKRHFVGKTVYCNCDDYRGSNYFAYFRDNFWRLGLKRLLCSCYSPQDVMSDGQPAVYIDWNGRGFPVERRLKSDGDFRSDECVEMLKQADIVCTNPPFSLFRAYTEQLFDYGKDFLILGNINAVSYRDFFGHVRDNKVWTGVSKLGALFKTPKKYGSDLLWVSTACWFTNLQSDVQKVPVELTAKYQADRYPKYDNYDAIEVARASDIPKDYFGVMGVPVTFIYKLCREQFMILDVTERHNRWFPKTKVYTGRDTPDYNHKNSGACLMVDGELKTLYKRLLIQRTEAL